MAGELTSARAHRVPRPHVLANESDESTSRAGGAALCTPQRQSPVSGQPPVGASRRKGEGEHNTRRPHSRSLTAAEKEILALMANGLTINEMCLALSLSKSAVTLRQASAYRKLDALNAPNAVYLWLKAEMRW